MLASVASPSQHVHQTVVPTETSSGLVVPSTAAPTMVEGPAIAQQQQQQAEFFSHQMPVVQPVTTSSDFDSLLMSSTTDSMTPLFATAATAAGQPNAMPEQPSSTSFAMPFEEAIASAVTADFVIPATTAGPVMASQFCYQ